MIALAFTVGVVTGFFASIGAMAYILYNSAKNKDKNNVE